MAFARQVFSLLLVTAALLVPATARASHDTWDCSSPQMMPSGYFFENSKWADHSAPTGFDSVEFGCPYYYFVYWAADATTRSMSVTNGAVTFQPFGGPYTWTITDGSTADVSITGGYLGLGYPGSIGSLILDIDDALTVDSGGTLYVSLESQVECHDTIVGSTGTGVLQIHSGGSVSDGSAYIGRFTGSSGTVLVNDGTWTNSGLTVGLNGTGILNISNGGSVSNWRGYVASQPDSTGTVAVTGEGSTWQSRENLYLGGTDTTDGGDATLELSEGGQVYVGDINPVTVTWPAPSVSALVVSDDDTVGGDLVVRNGATLDNDRHAILGYNDGETGYAKVTGAGSTWTNYDRLYVGRLGVGILDIEDGGQVSDGIDYVGLFPGSTGTVTVAGVGSTWTNDSELNVGFSGTGTLIIADGGQVSNRWGYMGRHAFSTGTATVTGAGSTWQSRENLCLGWTDTTDGGDASLELIGGGRVYVGDIDPTTVTLGSSYSAVTVSGGLPSGGDLVISNDADLSNDGVAYLGYNAGETGNARVSGAGSTWTNSEFLYVGGNGAGTLTVEAGGLVSSAKGYVGCNPTSTGTAKVTGTDSTWTNTGDIEVGRMGTGRLTVEAGGLVSNTHGILGWWSGSDGKVTVTGADSTWTNSGSLSVGEEGTGTLIIEDGGSVLTNGSDGFVALKGGSTGKVTVTGEASTWQCMGYLYLGGGPTEDGGDASVSIPAGGGRLYVGDIKPATVSLLPIWSAVVVSDRGGSGGELWVGNAAALDTDNHAYLGYNAGETGTAMVTGAGSTWTHGGPLYIGDDGDGTLTIEAGGRVDSGSSWLGFDSSSTGTATVTGGGSTWEISDYLEIGTYGEGTLTIQAGGQVSAWCSYLGLNSSSTGKAKVRGVGSKWYNGEGLVIGERGDGTLTIEAGGWVGCDIGSLGYSSVGTGRATVAGSGSTWNNWSRLYVGREGAGILNIEDGGQVSTGLMSSYVGFEPDSSGTVTVTGAGSTWGNGKSLYVGGDWVSARGTGEITVAGGGTVDVAETLKVWGSGTVNLQSGGSILTDVFDITAGGTFNFTGGTLCTTEFLGDLTMSGGCLDVGTGVELDLAGVFCAGPGGVTLSKTGNGVLMINGPQDHAVGSLFEIWDGTVWLNTDASGTGQMEDADLSILVADATLGFGCNQHLDTLTIDEYEQLCFSSPHVVMVKHLVLDGVDLGPMTLGIPEPATLALLAAGGLGLALRRRRT